MKTWPTEHLAAAGVALLGVLIYARVIFMSKHKWFHVMAITLVGVLGLQVFNFFKQQSEFELEIAELKKKLANPKEQLPSEINLTKSQSTTEDQRNLVKDRKASFDDMPESTPNTVDDLTQKIKEYNKIIDVVEDNKKKEEMIEKLSKQSQNGRQQVEKEFPITRICITGGPCAGKTTALVELTVVLQ